jgi:cytosine/adenosine deaminase-related metal-dependent hydrolase
MSEVIFRGRALTGEDLEEHSVEIRVEHGIITAIEEIGTPGDAWICPAFFNAHTHLGDTIAMDYPAVGDLAALVTPPHGLKHRLMAGARREDLIAAMRASIREMIESGTAGFADFREGGKDGVRALQEAGDGLPCLPVIFGRDDGEFIADGFGVSSARDLPRLEEQVSAARRAGKRIAFHAGEQDPDDVNAALAFDPDLLIHCTHATRRQLRECAEREIPIVVCPRSNWRLNVTRSSGHPPIRAMLDLGIRLLIGTDNVMFTQPDMFREMAFTATVYGAGPRELLTGAIGGSALFNRPFFLEKNISANFMVIDTARANIRYSRDLCTSLVHRVSPEKIVKKVFNS